MDLLSLVKEKLTDSVIVKISSFLGEHPEKIDLALNTAVPTVLGGIVQKANTPEEASKLLDILKEGGHTGDILDDVSGLLGHFDKTQMLITIGSNIASHFFGEKTNSIIDTLSSVSEVRKTSASSLLGLSTPLVLGAIGKVVAREGLGVSGLMKLLSSQKDSLQKALPPAIYNQLDMRNSPTHLIKETIEEPKPVQQTVSPPPVKKDNSNAWIPWILLLLLGLGALAWVKGCKNEFLKNKTDNDSLSLKVGVPSVSTKNDSAALTNASKASNDTLPSVLPNTSPSNKAQTTVTKEKEAVSATTKEVAKPTPSISASAGSLNDKLANNSDTWIGLEGVTFKKNSAEIISQNQLDEVVRFLKNNSKAKVRIGAYHDGDSRVTEDRAYAVRDILIGAGISDNKIQMNSGTVGESSAAKVAVKIIK